jgi:hypothetical protein
MEFDVASPRALDGGLQWAPVSVRGHTEYHP